MCESLSPFAYERLEFVKYVFLRSQWAWPGNTGSNHNAGVLHHLFLGCSCSTSSLDHIILSPVPSNFLLPSCLTTCWLMCDAYVVWDQSHVMTHHMISSLVSRCPALISFSVFNTVLKQQVSWNLPGGPLKHIWIHFLSWDVIFIMLGWANCAAGQLHDIMPPSR